MNSLVKYLVEGILKEETGITVLMPGGFKPPHGGHLDLAKKYASQPNVSRVTILIGPKEREGITRDTSIAVWKTLLTGTPNIEVKPVQEDNPLLAAYKFIETASPGTYALAASSKGDDYKRVQSFVQGHSETGKYHRAGVNVVELPLDTTPLAYSNRTDNLNGKGVSASILRSDIAKQDFTNFKSNYPNTPENVIKMVFNRLTGGKVQEGIIFNKTILNEGVDFVSCKLCGKHMSKIAPQHLKDKHGISFQEYKQRYPEALTICEALSAVLKEKNPMKNKENVQKNHNSKIKKYGSLKKATNQEKKVQTCQDRYGTDNPAKNTNIKHKISEGVKKSYTSELKSIRKEHFNNVKNSDTYKEKMYELGLMYRPGERLDKKYYTQKVRELTQQNYTKHFHKIENAQLRGHDYHLDHIYSIHEGYLNKVKPEIIAHPANLRIMPKKLNEAKGSVSHISLTELMLKVNHFDKTILLEGGAASHMNHPYEDYDLTFNDIKGMIEAALSGTVEYAQEKLDGQNLMVTYKDGKVRAARNKGHVKNAGETSLTLKQVEDTFAGRGSIQTAFTEAVRDLETAINRLTPAQKQKFFENGKKFLNLEVLFPETANVIPYGATQLRLHNITEYDPAGNVVSTDQDSAVRLQGALKQVEAENQKTYQIRVTDPITINKSTDYKKQRDELLGILDNLRKQYNIKSEDKLGIYLQTWWKNLIESNAKRLNYKVPQNVVQQLINRWAFSNKEVNIKSIRDQITSEEFKQWVDTFEKTELIGEKKNAIRPIETLFLKLGAYTLKNISSLVALNPNQSVRQIKKDLTSAIEQIKQAAKTPSMDDDDAALKFLKRELQRLKDIGGFNAIVPTEGIVFKYNGKLYKLTGSFAPINQILGYMRF